MLCKLVLPSKEVFKLPCLPRTYDELFTAVRIRLQEASLRDFMIKYMDADKELVSLNNDEDLQTAIITNQMDQVTTLRVFVVFKESSVPVTRAAEPAVKQTNSSYKLLQALEKAKVDERAQLTQSQAFDLLKNIPMESSKAVKGPTQSALTEGQIGAISDFIGLRVKQAMDRNIRELVSSMVAKFQDGRNNPENFNNSRLSEKGAERKQQRSPAQTYYTPTTRKANWFANYCADCICSECSRHIQDIKYMCLECSNYKCCQECENKAEHQHPLLKLRASAAHQIGSRMTHSHISPEQVNTAGRNSLQKQPSMKSTCEKKTPYCGKIILENAEEQTIKAYPSQGQQITVVVENIGKEAWPKDVSLRCVNGNYRDRQEEVIPLNPGTKQVLHLEIEAPSQAGRYLSQWKLCYNDEEKMRCFGESLFIEIQVEGKKLQHSKTHDVNGPVKGRGSLTIRRGNTFSDTYSNKTEEKRKADNAETADKKKSVAAYLNDIFPGSIEEKHEFLEKCLCSVGVDMNDVTKIVELYLQNLGRCRIDKAFTVSENIEDRELPPHTL